MKRTRKPGDNSVDIHNGITNPQFPCFRLVCFPARLVLSKLEHCSLLEMRQELEQHVLFPFRFFQ